MKNEEREQALEWFRNRSPQMPGARRMYEIAIKALEQPEIIRCKDCKHWKDSDGVYRRGYGSESKCRINHVKVQEGTFYCGMAERRTDE